MAKTNTVLIKLVSSADTGFFYVTKKNPRSKTNKLELKKFDPIARKLQGSPDQQRDAAVKRGEFREILGNKLMREITLK